MNTDRSIYELCGGESGIRRLADDFYGFMETLPEAKHVRDMHPMNLARSIEKFGDFLVGWTGGPPVYIEKYGHPRLRRRHFPFPVDSRARDQWLVCMQHALAAHPHISADVATALFEAFARMANHLRNTPDSAE